MDNTFITKIHIGKVRHLENIDIETSDTQRKHLILTGKNGSGKTSLLETMRDIIAGNQRSLLVNERKVEGFVADKNSNIKISFSQGIDDISGFIFAYIPTQRSKLDIPTTIEKINVIDKAKVNQNANKGFLNYILSLDYQLYGAKTDNNTVLEASLSKWFDNFLAALQDIYGCPELQLQRDTKNLAFRIAIPGREPFALHEMSDGYTAFLNIYMELLMRFESTDAVVDYEKSAIVMIDEIETHLHVELQRRVLPFLTQMFPNVQFIIATHSPFVMTSLENAIVYDLEKNERLEKPSFYSYDTVVESFLDTSMYSNELQGYFARYKELCLKERTAEENDEFLQAKAEFEIRAIPSTELYIKFQELEKTRKAIKNGTSE
ncbi:MAG: AAA family ATPase [Defluviitaleaceae bacterium]|nr:AAA family ATPase [Defluviitaleaceae bacterium]